MAARGTVSEADLDVVRKVPLFDGLAGEVVAPLLAGAGRPVP